VIDPCQSRLVRFGLLGELEIACEGGLVTIAAPRQRALLALLLLSRGAPVGVERLAAELWGDRPPATAVKAVQVYVAQLRKALGEGVIVTRGRAYSVDLDRHELDVIRFEELAAEGRRLLADGDADAAASALRHALSLWRGAPLADFTYEEFAQTEIARLEDERLSVIEARVEADLARGFDDGLVGELQALVGAHPLRERLRGQLMVALYRSGRQAEALEQYRQTRRTLLEELGLEPSPALQALERAILAQDESLGAISPLRHLRSVPKRRALYALVAGGVLLVAAAAVTVVILAASGDGGISPPVAANSVAAVDPRSGRIVGEYPVGASPAALTVGPSGAWVLSADDKTVSRIDPRAHSVKTIGVGALPTDVVAGAGGVWIGTGKRFDQATFAGWVAGSVVRMNARTGGIESTVQLPRRGDFVSNTAAQHLAIARGWLWTIAPDASLVRIDPRTSAVVETIDTSSLPVAITGDARSVWVLNADGSIARIGAGGRVTAHIRVPAEGLTSLAIGAGSVWATSPQGGTLWRIDPGQPSVQRTIDVGEGADSVAFGDGSVWVTNSLTGTLIRIDPGANRVDRTIVIGNTPTAVAVGHGSVWVAVAGGTEGAAPTESRRGAVVPLGDTFCGSLVSGVDPPRFLVASDLPLQGGPRFPTAQMSEAIRFVLRRHGFRAGEYPLAYQSCDDSTAQRGLFDFEKCAANAKAYARNATVIGVIGPYNSGCAFAQLPIANGAGLAVVSPTSSDVGLTRLAVGMPRNALKSLYPTGQRTYARVIPPDDAQSAAAVVFARRLGVRRVYVLNDRDTGAPLAFYFRRAASRLGLQVVGHDTWDPRRPPAATALGQRLARRDVDAVYLCGLIDSGVGIVLAAVRRAVGFDKPVIGCSGVLPSSLLFEQAGRAARGTYVTLEGLAAESLDGAGRAFLHDFAATQAGRPITLAAVYAAEATEVLLDAIARSDGTRESVARRLLETERRDGLLGSFRIDARGEATPARTTIVQLQATGRSNAVQSYDGSRIAAVIAVPQEQLRP
jgi:branched-chain amino acid transport system substrate-binding protein